MQRLLRQQARRPAADVLQVIPWLEIQCSDHRREGPMSLRQHPDACSPELTAEHPRRTGSRMPCATPCPHILRPVNKITEVNSAIQPVMVLLIAPLAMPTRWASGEVPVWQLLLAMALTAATAVLLVWVVSSVYRRALLMTGRRVKLREMIGSQARS
jgi:hypothetical protein